MKQCDVKYPSEGTSWHSLREERNEGPVALIPEGLEIAVIQWGGEG